MQDEIVTRILNEAAQLDGSTQALASRLNAPEPTLRRWMAGHAQTPLRAFLAVLEFLMQAERKDAEQPPGADADEPGKLVFPLGPLLARCARCDGTEFLAAQPGRLRLTSLLLCSGCATEIVHGDLIAQLARDAVQQSRAVNARTRRNADTVAERMLRAQHRIEQSRRALRPPDGEE